MFRKRFHFLYWLIPLLLAFAFRFHGLNWDELHLLNPDERFLVQVTESLRLPATFREWMDPGASPFNPENRGFDFYVYGTLPLLFAKLASGIFPTTPLVLTARVLNAVFDLLTLVCIGVISGLLWRNRRAVFISMLGYAFLVAAIQQAHFFTVDLPAVFFCTLTLLLSVLFWQEQRTARLLLWAALSGLALGAAMACKVSAAFFVLLPAMLILLRIIRPQKTDRSCWPALAGLAALTLTLAFSFRIFQPYAFESASLLNFTLSPRWLETLRELAAQSGGAVVFPPAWQWADRSFTFVFKNLALYGAGIPLTFFLLTGLFFAAIQAIRRKDAFLAVTLGFSGAFAIWQACQFSQMMRYWLPLFPLLFVLCGAVFIDRDFAELPGKTQKIGRIVMAGALALSGFWAVGFSAIYARPHTRVQASDWIYRHIPAPLQAGIETEDGAIHTQQVSVPYQQLLEAGGEASLLPVSVEAGDDLQMLELASLDLLSGENCRLQAQVCPDMACEKPLEETRIDLPGIAGSFRMFFPEQIPAPEAGKLFIALALSGEPSGEPSGEHCGLRLSGDPSVYLLRDGRPVYQILNGTPPQLRENESITVYFKAEEAGLLKTLTFAKPWLDSANASVEPFLLEIGLTNYDSGETATFRFETENNNDQGGESKIIHLRWIGRSSIAPTGGIVNEQEDTFDTPINNGTLTLTLPEPFAVGESTMVGVEIRNRMPDSLFMLRANRIATESVWDDALPLSTGGRRPYDSGSGYYGTLLDLDLFADEDLLQREQLLAKIEAADFWVISSTRIYGAAARIREKYPLLEPLYRQALGCSESVTLAACFAGIAEADGAVDDRNPFFTVRKVFSSEPSLFGLTLDTQAAEEAFTVYDHPKVILLEKKADFNLSEFRKPLDAVNLSAVQNKNPVEYMHMESISLMQSAAQTAAQQSGGTWSELFDRSALINQNQFVGALVWLAFFWLLGWGFYPLTRIVFSALRDKGYGVSKLFGLLCLGLTVWLGAFFGIAYSRTVIAWILAAWLLLNLILFIGDRKTILREVRTNFRAMLQSELVFLACFLFFLAIRLGNPDLWHPYKGGEKPMDFSYFNAVLKSSVFPPYDPWFAGGTLNYYYYGFFLSGLPVKLIGIIPSVAYNLILPTWYGFLGVGAFSAGAGIYAAAKRKFDDSKGNSGAVRTGLAAVLLMQVLGNLGTIKIILTKLTELGAAGAEISGLKAVIFFFTGIGRLIGGQTLPLYPGDWYWLPSRAIPGEPITEFPFFTFLYGDPHAHLFALPLTVLALVWMAALLRRSDEAKQTGFWQALVPLLAGTLIIGALIPTNTWDTPTYLLLAVVLLIGVGLRRPLFRFRSIADADTRIQKLLSATFSVLLLCGLTILLYLPYLQTNSREMGINVWQGDRTPLWSYWMHWGLFLFLIISWYALETKDWMHVVRYVDFRRMLAARRIPLMAAGLFILCALAYCAIRGVWIGWTALPLMVWSLLLLLRGDTSLGKRALFFLVGSGLFITLFVEFFSLRGDLGRMNMVFKLYLQAWVIFSLPAAFGAVFCFKRTRRGAGERASSSSVGVWQFLAAVLLIGTAAYPIFASVDKIRDRMSTAAPHTLDGMAYMQTSQFFQDGFLMDLSQDYDAIRWMQDNVSGSPVIVEGHATEYKWGSRYTVYTGLPGVVGWNYHQRQQRGPMSDQVWERVNAVEAFYNSPMPEEKMVFLREYDVAYIIVGQMERGLYTADGIAAFAAGDGVYWDRVYQNEDTEIYRVR